MMMFPHPPNLVKTGQQHKTYQLRQEHGDLKHRTEGTQDGLNAISMGQPLDVQSITGAVDVATGHTFQAKNNGMFLAKVELLNLRRESRRIVCFHGLHGRKRTLLRCPLLAVECQFVPKLQQTARQSDQVTLCTACGREASPDESDVLRGRAHSAAGDRRWMVCEKISCPRMISISMRRK